MHSIKPGFQYILFLLMASLPTFANAHSKTDIITMYNGDRITCEIKKLFGGILECSTDAMGTVKVEWKEIARLESKFNYEIRLSSGSRYYGTVSNSDSPGQLTIEDLYGAHDVEWMEVVEVRPIEEKLLDRFDVYVSGGYSYTKASDVAQTTLNTEIGYEDERTRNALTGRQTYTNTDSDSSNSSRWDLSRRSWSDREKLFRLFFASYESNDELGLDDRITVGGGLGRYAIDSNRMRLSGSLGIQGIAEAVRSNRSPEASSETENRESGEVFLKADFAAWRFDTPELDLSINTNLYPSLTDDGRVRGDGDIRIRWELLEDLFWDVTAYGTYDSKSESDKEFDYGITTGIGWKY
jgi:hypothetical protein